MAIGQSDIDTKAPRKRGWLFWLGVFLAGSVILSTFTRLIAPSTGSAQTAVPAGVVDDVAPYKPLTPQQRAAALRRMTVETDKVEDITYNYDSSTRRGPASPGFYAYAGQKTGEPPYLRLVVRYAGDGWLFFSHITLKTDALKLDLDGLHPEREVGSGYVTEWIDSPVTRREYALLEAVAISKTAVLRLEGPHFYRDRTITAREKAAILNVVMAYRALGAKAPP